MSYILEALKKLEEKRRMEAGPSLLSTQSRPRRDVKRNFPWRQAILFVLMLNIGILLWQFHPWRPARGTGIEKSGTGTTPIRRDSEGVRGDMPRTRVRRSQFEVKREQGRSIGYDDYVPSREAGPSREELRRTVKIVGMTELPASVRQKLPDLSISGHFYDSRPSVRVVTVSGRVLHEGSTVAPGLSLERITPDGAVFSFEGYRFQKGVF